MSKDAILKWVLGIVGAFVVSSVGYLLTLPTKIVLLEERGAVLAGQLDDTLALVDALHPRGSALAGGPPEDDDEAEQRAAKIRGLMKRAPAPEPIAVPLVLLMDDDDSAAPECPPCPCECPEPTPEPPP